MTDHVEDIRRQIAVLLRKAVKPTAILTGVTDGQYIALNAGMNGTIQAHVDPKGAPVLTVFDLPVFASFSWNEKPTVVGT